MRLFSRPFFLTGAGHTVFFVSRKDFPHSYFRPRPFLTTPFRPDLHGISRRFAFALPLLFSSPRRRPHREVRPRLVLAAMRAWFAFPTFFQNNFTREIFPSLHPLVSNSYGQTRALGVGLLTVLSSNGRLLFGLIFPLRPGEVVFFVFFPRRFFSFR